MMASTSSFNGGYLNINKPKGWTSTDVVRRLKGVTRSGKIGHGGTLDPIATGVLPICIGSATRFAETILLGTKSYRITIELGYATDTYDSTGEITNRSSWLTITLNQVENVLKEFTGKFDQVPPMYSAIHHNGKRLYELAREGIEVVRPARPVEVMRNELVDFEPPQIIVDVECAHGFYARTLADEIGKQLGTYAHMTGLVRTHAGVFKLEDTITVEQVRAAADNGNWQELIIPIDVTLQHLGEIKLNSKFVEMVQHGQPLPIESLAGTGQYAPGDRIRAYGPAGELLAILVCEPERLGWRPEKVLMTI